jgi:Spy/CpxP family protein refolding chaperone
MQRSKQQAMMFLLGAVLVGGALGFSADRVLTENRKDWGPRLHMYQDLGLTEAQRCVMDSLLDDRSVQIKAVMNPVQPQLDSIRRAAHQQVLGILSPEQRVKLEERTAEQHARDSTRRAVRDSIRAVGKATSTCN